MPQVDHRELVNTPPDVFLLRRLEERGLVFSPPADKTTLIRRAYLDVIGLPPSPEAVDTFLADVSPTAYAHLSSCSNR